MIYARFMRVLAVVGLWLLTLNDALDSILHPHPLLGWTPPLWVTIILQVWWLAAAWYVIWLGARELERVFK